MSDFTGPLQYVTINDFSPGIINYGLGGLPVAYTPNAPVGSASYSVRCMNQAGIGLMPFPKYYIPPGSTSFALGYTGYSTGMIAMGGYVLNADVTYEESVYASATDVANLQISQPVLFFGVGGIAPPNPVDLTFTTAESGNQYVFFTRTRTLYGSPEYPYQQVWWNYRSNMAFNPPFTSTPTSNPDVGAVALPDVNPTGCYSYGSRVMTFANNPPDGSLSPADQQTDNENIYFTDPPESDTLYDGYDIFAPENASGYGAWGSMSTGELFLIKRAGGGVLVTGDLAAPSSAIFLPGVNGASMAQRGIPTPVGMVYATQTTGVYAWNGGNTSEKISQQIPDDATVRTLGLSFHDVSNNIVFFGNNWCYNTITNSWWQSEEPGIINFGSFAQSQYYGNIMYCLPDIITSVEPYVFDFETYQSSYTWVSNPVPPLQGALSSLQSVEIVASNGTAYPATVTITPTIPPGQTPFPQQNPTQSQTFTVPPTTVAFRQSLPLGYTDYNIEVRVDAANTNDDYPAPTIHAITLGFGQTRTTRGI